MPLPFTNELSNLHSDTSHKWDHRTRGRAPHKPFLLLSILDGIETGWITGPQIELSRDLVCYVSNMPLIVQNHYINVMRQFASKADSSDPCRQAIFRKFVARPVQDRYEKLNFDHLSFLTRARYDWHLKFLPRVLL